MGYKGEFRGPDADEAWRLISTAFTVASDVDREDRGAYWLDVIQGTSLLLAALHILASEMKDHYFDRPSCLGPDPGADDIPLLVKQIVKMTLDRSDAIKEVVIKNLL